MKPPSVKLYSGIRMKPPDTYTDIYSLTHRIELRVPPGGYGAPPPQGYGQPAYGAPPGQYPGAPPPVGQYPGAAPYGAPAPGAYGAPPPGQYGCPPGIDPTIHSWFTTVDADKSGRITAIELQQALVNGNWSRFNPETCRLMIGMFDRDLSGTIDIQEFQQLWHYIQQWKCTFDKYDRDRSGFIDRNELGQAFREMQFNVSPQFVNIVAFKFDTQARQRLTMDSFIQACVMLKSLTDAFRARDARGVGSVQLSYEEFLSLAVANKP